MPRGSGASAAAEDGRTDGRYCGHARPQARPPAGLALTRQFRPPTDRPEGQRDVRDVRRRRRRACLTCDATRARALCALHP